MSWYKNVSNVDVNSIKHRVAHSDECGNNCKCRQNFNNVLASSSSESCYCIHKFAQKFGFNGAWDSASKLIKSDINKLEVKNIRVENAHDCCRHMTVELTVTRAIVLNGTNA